MVQRVSQRSTFHKIASFERAIDLLIFGGLFFVALIVTFSAIGLENIGRDSGVFLYAGQRILAGDVPYRDVWDHKGPILYYINALGLWIGGGDISGVILLEFLSILLTVWLAASFLKRAFGYLSAVFASVLFLSSLALLLSPGNWTEEYALPFQFMALYSLWKMETGSRNVLFPLAIGATAAATFLLQPNLIGVQLSICLYLLLSATFRRKWRYCISQVTSIAVGAVFIVLPLFIYLGFQGALDDLWNAAVRYNLIYASGSLWSKLSASLHGLKELSPSGIAFVAPAGWVIAGYQLWRNRAKGAPASLYGVALIALPLEFTLASVSGRTYRHYYLIWLPVMTLLCAIFASQFLHLFRPTFINFRFGQVRLASLWLFAMLGIMSLLPAHASALGVWTALREERTVSDVVTFVWENTPEDGYLLIWGAEAEYNFLTGRPAPTRFVYQIPLFTPRYANAAMYSEFLSDIAAKKPLIIDASVRSRKVPPLPIVEREKKPDLTLPVEASPILQFIDENYRQVATLGEQQWPVFEYQGK